jgi:putative cardiolipin synthase
LASAAGHLRGDLWGLRLPGDAHPALRRRLFDPARYPWLERLAVTDRVVHEILGALLILQRSAAQVQARAEARRADVVISGPASDSAAVRLTSSVVSELIHDCRESLLVVSFAAFGVSEVVRELRKAAKRGVRIDLILESTTDQGGTLHGSVGAAAAFAEIQQDASFWIWPARRRPAVGASRAALHAKVIAADERVALIGSANLTDKALAVNLELGVIIRDPEIVGRIVRHFRSLMQPETGVLEPILGSAYRP